MFVISCASLFIVSSIPTSGHKTPFRAVIGLILQIQARQSVDKSNIHPSGTQATSKDPVQTERCLPYSEVDEGVDGSDERIGAGADGDKLSRTLHAHDRQPTRLTHLHRRRTLCCLPDSPTETAAALDTRARRSSEWQEPFD